MQHKPISAERVQSKMWLDDVTALVWCDMRPFGDLATLHTGCRKLPAICRSCLSTWYTFDACPGSAERSLLARFGRVVAQSIV